MSSAGVATTALRATWLGRVGYVGGWRLQEAIATRVRRGGPDRLLLLEHDPVYTIGRRGSTANLLAGAAELRDAGASVYRVDRGGDITYHGPGQLVGYPIVGLGDAPDLVGYVRALESALIDAVAAFGVSARTIRGKTGVWVDLPDGRNVEHRQVDEPCPVDEPCQIGGPCQVGKLAAIGVRISRGVSTHGFALNVATDLSAFARMIPCGFAHEAASLRRLGVDADVAVVARTCADAFARRLGRELVWDAAVAAPEESEIPEGAPVRTARDLVASPDLEALAAS